MKTGQAIGGRYRMSARSGRRRDSNKQRRDKALGWRHCQHNRHTEDKLGVLELVAVAGITSGLWGRCLLIETAVVVDSTLLPTQGGTDLRLAIVNTVARLHGGALRLENRAEGGARVTVGFA